MNTRDIERLIDTEGRACDVGILIGIIGVPIVNVITEGRPMLVLRRKEDGAPTGLFLFRRPDRGVAVVLGGDDLFRVSAVLQGKVISSYNDLYFDQLMVAVLTAFCAL